MVPVHVSGFPFPFFLPHIGSTTVLPALPAWWDSGWGRSAQGCSRGSGTSHSSASAVNLGDSLNHTQPNCEARAFHYHPSRWSQLVICTGKKAIQRMMFPCHKDLGKWQCPSSDAPFSTSRYSNEPSSPSQMLAPKKFSTRESMVHHYPVRLHPLILVDEVSRQ